MKKSILYVSLLLTIVLAMTATTVLAAPDVSLKPKKTPPAQGTEVTSPEVTPAPHGKSEQHRNNQNNQSEKNDKVNFRGLVVTSDATSLTLELKDGSTQVIKMDANTVIKYPTHFTPSATEVPTATETATVTETATATATPAGPLAGLQVMVKTVKQTDGGFLALKVMVIPGKPEKVQRVGEVTAYTEGSSITIKAKDGKEYTFEISTSTKILPVGSTIKVGDTVTVIMPRVLTGQPLVAAGIVLHTADTNSEPSETPETTETPEPTEAPETTTVPGGSGD